MTLITDLRKEFDDSVKYFRLCPDATNFKELSDAMLAYQQVNCCLDEDLDDYSSAYAAGGVKAIVAMLKRRCML